MIIFNKSITEGVFPSPWKQSFISPVYKSGDKNNVENYRPIAIINGFSKLLESIIANKLYSYVEGKISSSQHGGVKKKSTETNLFVFPTQIHSVLSKKGQIDVAYTDFSKAFDRVNHNLLLSKL